MECERSFAGDVTWLFGHEDGVLWLVAGRHSSERTRVALDDSDLLLDPANDDLELAAAFEGGEINAFEYPDGHTFPPDREIGQRRALIRDVDRRDQLDWDRLDWEVKAGATAADTPALKFDFLDEWLDQNDGDFGDEPFE